MSTNHTKKKTITNKLIPNISPKEFSFVIDRLRSFFRERDFLEVHTQNRLSILAACEDPFTISTFNYANNIWPLPQTGQMWLEYELLNNPNVPGFFCVSTSYRNEPNPIAGRHNIIFPMFEFEIHGGIDRLIEMEIELLSYLGLDIESPPQARYLDIAQKYNAKYISNQEEELLLKDYGEVFFLTHFPEYTAPFWNMKRNDNDSSLSNKVDVILGGMETIGSAERSCDTKQMYNSFLEIENGKYSEKLFELFGKERVLTELEEFLDHDFFIRSGGGIGVTRLIRGLKRHGIL